jgi:curved DNA-binding protein CbpA
MGDAQNPSEALSLLARLYREKRSGLVTLGPPEDPVRVFLRDGHIAAMGPVAPPPEEPQGPDDSARLRLERILVEIGIRRGPPKPATSAPARADVASRRLLDALSDESCSAAFEELAAPPSDLAETAGATEPILLEAVRLRNADAVRAHLGDLDQRLVATPALTQERTLTQVEGYLLSRIDGTASARQVLQLVPLDPEEAERSLLGLLITGRVELQPAPATRAVSRQEAAPPPDPVAAGPPAAEPPAPEPSAPEVSTAPAEGPAAPELDPETLATRREIIEVFQSLPLKNHFEVLGVEPGCTDADVTHAYTALARRFHPDVHFGPGLADLGDLLEAIFIRVAEAREALGDAKSRASFEARSGVAVRPRAATSPPASTATPRGSPPRPSGLPTTPPPGLVLPPSEADYVTSEETLLRAQLLMLQAKYWDAISLLEAALPQLEPPRHRSRGRILLAKAYAKNPNWLRKAEEQLQEVLRADPTHVDAHYQLGLLYKAQGLAARAQGLLRRVLELKPDHREAATELAALEPPSGGLLKRLFGRGKAS